MKHIFEAIKIIIASVLCKTIPVRFHTRLSRLIYNYNSKSNQGLDWVIQYQPVKEIPAQKIFINTKEFIGWNILFLKHYEQDTNLMLNEFIQENFHVVEAGAHIGSETLLIASKVGKLGKVYAFEPNPIVMKRLRVNILLNDWGDRVDIFDIALGEKEGEISFYIKSEETPNQGMSSKYQFDNNVIEIIAIQQTLDHWVATQKIPRVDFLKMDVQGAEMDILNGASETIERYKPTIFMEADDSIQSDSMHTVRDLYEKMTSSGYNLYQILPNGGLHQMTFPQLKSGNWLAIHKSKKGL